ncbi:MAG: hypothetical protein ACLFPP_03185 [Spirochaetaceae bacterium]
MALSIGSCSWKFPSWEGLVYSSREPESYLAEYSSTYRTVEVDQWFWSLFGTDTIRLPRPEPSTASSPDSMALTGAVNRAIL